MVPISLKYQKGTEAITMNNEVYTMVPKLYTIAKYGHTKVNRRRVFKLHIAAEAYTIDHEGYTMDYEGYTMARWPYDV